MILRHNFLFFLLVMTSVFALWAGAHIYFGVPFPFLGFDNIQSVSKLMACATLGLLVLAGRRYDLIKKDLMVDLLFLPIFFSDWFCGARFCPSLCLASRRVLVFSGSKGKQRTQTEFLCR